MDAPTPLLSICVPTYKRAALLRSVLRCLAPQVKAQNGLVELVVSDNASPDDTGAVVEWAQQFGPIRYHRNAENVGAAGNFLQLAQKLAAGEYCWLIGDDDLVQPDGVAHVVNSLLEHPEIDYAFVNYASIANKREDGRLISPEEFEAQVLPASMCFDTAGTRVVDRWEDIMLLTRNASLFTYIGSQVLRTSLWRSQEIPLPEGPEHQAMVSTFPFAWVVGLHMAGRPALYIGAPLVLLFIGPQEWHAWYAYIQLVSMTELAEFFRSRGVRTAPLRYYLNLLLANNSYAFWELLLKKETKGRAGFHPSYFLRYITYPMFWRMISLYPLNTFVKPLFRPLTKLVKSMLGGRSDTARANPGEISS